MLDQPTVFVIGAGAGDGLNMPLGDKLSEMIAGYVSIRHDFDRKKSGDDIVVAALAKLAQQRQLDRNELHEAGRLIAGGMRHLRSIDNYIHAHGDNKLIKIVSKIAIVRAIIQAEKDSPLFVNDQKHPLRFRGQDEVTASWLQDLLFLLVERIVVKDNLGSLFKNISIINFNYDRCVEHFLLRSLNEVFHGRGSYFAELMAETLEIIHPYGVVGRLPWWRGQQASVPFGGNEYGDDLPTLSGQVLTYNEQIADSTQLTKIRRMIAEAKRIVFLGFHFHPQNVSLLTALNTGLNLAEPAQVFATRVRRSDADLQMIEQRIRTMLNGREIKFPGSVYTQELSCKEFFRDFGTTLGG